MQAKLTKAIVILIALIIFGILLVGFLKMGIFTSESVKVEGIKVDCEFQQGICLEPVNGECPFYDVSYKTVKNTNCDEQGKVCCVRE